MQAILYFTLTVASALYLAKNKKLAKSQLASNLDLSNLQYPSATDYLQQEEEEEFRHTNFLATIFVSSLIFISILVIRKKKQIVVSDTTDPDFYNVNYVQLSQTPGLTVISQEQFKKNMELTTACELNKLLCSSEYAAFQKKLEEQQKLQEELNKSGSSLVLNKNSVDGNL